MHGFQITCYMLLDTEQTRGLGTVAQPSASVEEGHQGVDPAAMEAEQCVSADEEWWRTLVIRYEASSIEELQRRLLCHDTTTTGASAYNP